MHTPCLHTHPCSVPCWVGVLQCTPSGTLCWIQRIPLLPSSSACRLSALVCRGSEGCQVMSCWDKGLSCVHWISSWDNGLRAWSSGWSMTRFRILHAFQRWRCSRLAPELACVLKVASGTSIGLRFTSIVFLRLYSRYASEPLGAAAVRLPVLCGPLS